MSSTKFNVCTRCCMDTSDPEIVFDDKGVCNHCHQYTVMEQNRKREKQNRPWRSYEIQKNKGQYNCLIGLSGGVDSSLALHRAVEQGLKPLTFSIDNGWNSPKADENIMRMVEKLKVPFYRYTINLERFRELQTAFIKGGVKNLEAITDHILFATTYEMAVKNNIRFVITGGNVATESIMPRSWGEDPRDLRWIKGVYKKVTGRRLEGLPTISLLKEQYYRIFKKIQFFPILDYEEYNREKAKTLLKNEYGWQDYGDKHQESIFTWWFQSYYLFYKWGIDKRKAHFASLINSGQMTRKDAMDELLKSPEYPTTGLEGLAMQYPKKEYKDYPNSEKVRKLVSKLYAITKRFRHNR